MLVRLHAPVIKFESAEVIEVIRTVHVYGNGTPEDPMRAEARYWTLEGDLLAKIDINEDPLSPLPRWSDP